MDAKPAATDDHRKRFGAFYTPQEIVDFLVEWAVRAPTDRILEPAAGDGAFVAAAASRLRSLGATMRPGTLVAVEVRATEASKIRSLVPLSTVHARDFFELGPADLPAMTSVIGNPPFIRSQRFKGEPRARGRERASDQKVELSGLASSWAHFVVHASAFLDRKKGRIGLVLPAELLHADYAEPIRSFLLRRFASVTILAFDKRAFHPALVDTVLLLGDQLGPKGLHIWRLTDQSQLSPDVLLGGLSWPSAAKRWSAGIHQVAARLYGELVGDDRLCRLSSIASVDIGVVTGANAFFIFDEGRREAIGISRDAVSPIVHRGRDLGGMVASGREASWLLDLRSHPELCLEKSIAAYLRQGVQSGIPNGYKCSRRDPWWIVPIPKARPDLLLPYMHHLSPRLIANPELLRSTNLVHAVTLLEDAPDPRALALASLSAATAFSAEVEGRVYGGGVLKLETRDAERLLVPRLSKVVQAKLLAEFGRLDGLVRAGRRDEASQEVDDLLGIDHEGCAAAARVFRERRHGLRTRAS